MAGVAFTLGPYFAVKKSAKSNLGPATRIRPYVYHDGGLA